MPDPIVKGSIVQVQSRTWPGSNKPGGVARITAIHPPIDNASTTYDVAYVLGGKEKGVEEQYVTLQSAEDTSDAKKKRGVGGSELHISTSTASLALSASPLATPLHNDDDVKKEGSPMEEEDEQVIEERRKRKNSMQEDILMGSSRNSSYNSLGVAAAAASSYYNNDEFNNNLNEEPPQPPQAKRAKIENNNDSNSTVEEAETSNDEDDSAASTSSLYKHHKTAIWSARKHLDIQIPSFETNNISKGGSTTTTSSNNNNVQRWRSHQIAEDYISLASAMLLPPTTHLQTFGYTPHLGQYPIEQVTALGYLTSPLRRPSVIEKWSPYEITTFEAALALHGKHFHQVQKWIKTKNTKEVIEFYYIWKKTSHYRRWKSSFCEEIEESVCSSSDDEGDGETKVGRK